MQRPDIEERRKKNAQSQQESIRWHQQAMKKKTDRGKRKMEQKKDLSNAQKFPNLRKNINITMLKVRQSSRRTNMKQPIPDVS
jgi:hypothetical protein